MKTEVLNLKKYLKKLNQTQEDIHSSVGFQDKQRPATYPSKNAVTNFLQELKDAINSGDDSIWRMWR